MAGANIYTNRGVGVAVADKKGEFMINNGELLHNIDTLCFSFVGYRTRKFAVASLLQKKKCDFTASIPMKGDIDSLNASVAAGVLAYEIVRQRLKA